MVEEITLVTEMVPVMGIRDNHRSVEGTPMDIVMEEVMDMDRATLDQDSVTVDEVGVHTDLDKTVH